MREKPPYLQNPEVGTIQFDATEYGLIDGRFASAIATHGDGESFGWTAGGGEYKYTIRRIDGGYARGEDVIVSSWEFTQTDADGQTDTLYIDIPEAKVVDIFGEHAAPKLINDISNAVIDLSWECEELSKGMPGVILEDNAGIAHLMPRNPLKVAEELAQMHEKPSTDEEAES